MSAFHLSPPARSTTYAAHVLAMLAVMTGTITHAALTGLADEPLITQAEFQPKPNLMVILDDSGSMDWTYMPDDANFAAGRFGLYSAQCNGVAYDPSIEYPPPLKADGTSYPAAKFTAARTDGFDGDSDTVDLSQGISSLAITTEPAISITATSFTLRSNSGTLIGAGSFIPGAKIALTANGNRVIEATINSWTYNTTDKKGVLTLRNVTRREGSSTASNWTATLAGQHHFRYLGIEPKMDYAYAANGTRQNNEFFKECSAGRSNSVTATSGNVFEFNIVSAESSEAEKTKYANWYSYYRKRYLLMRTAMGQAVNPLNDSYRLGFMTINKRNAAGTSSASFRPVSDFNASQKVDFYSSLYTAGAGGSTPLRAALSHAGRYFAKDLGSQKTDPMQYACQRNYALLTTDGYWNENFSNGGLGNANMGDSDQDGATVVDSDKSTSRTTLADIAHYYYATDLRSPARNNCTGAAVGSNPGQDVCSNIFKPTAEEIAKDKDVATHQHMTTFTIGLGIVGTLSQDSLPSAWPSLISNNSSTTADDLWHASVNGRGAHYSAQNATQLSTAIKGIVKAIQEKTGAGSATSTSTLDLVQGDGNVAFEASYTTGSWKGDVVARQIDSVTAVPSTESQWSASQQLDTAVPADRKIYFKNGTTLSAFTWSNLSSTLKAHFTNACSANPVKLTQCAALSTEHQGVIDGGEALVEYLRGDRSQETTQATPLFRARQSRLGDIVNSKPIHVGKPPFEYSDSGYAEFKATHAARKKVLYVGANDGMLHALDAATGAELWAYIPTPVMSNLHKLADVKYGSNSSQPHVFFVDGKTVQGDVKIDGVWKTILVGGLNKGGRAYYALDITDPDAPQTLWEFSHSDTSAHNNLGLSFSDPVISKLDNGTWTVAFGSGYNNVSPGDGKGRLYVVNAATGAIERNIVTSQGSTGTPAGLSKINVWRTSSSNNTAQRFYGGDLLGNLWRFDVDNLLQPHRSALLLAQMQDASGNPQPITTEPKLREYDKQSVIAVATGRYLGRDDIDDTQYQSIAAIRDPLTATGWGVVRSSDAFKQVTITKNGNNAAGDTQTVDWITGAGWWADFATGGERIAMPMEWDGARLLAATTIPNGNQCSSGGASWLYSFNLAGGATKGKEFSNDTVIVGFSVVTNSEGAPKILVRTSGNQTKVEDGTGLGGGTIVKPARRVSWRELH